VESKSRRRRAVDWAKDDLGMTPEAQERKQTADEERRARWRADDEARRNTFAGVTITDGVIASQFGGGPVAGARATVDTAGQLTRRITATRLALVGPLALGLQKNIDGRELYLLIEGQGWGISVPVPATRGAEARAFAVRINAASTAATSPPTATTQRPGDDAVDQIRRLGELRDAGLLTDEEFEAKKTELLQRL